MTIDLHRNAAQLNTPRENLNRDIDRVKNERKMLETLAAASRPLTYTELSQQAGISKAYLTNLTPKATDLGRIVQYINPLTNETSYAPRYRMYHPIALITQPWITIDPTTLDHDDDDQQSHTD